MADLVTRFAPSPTGFLHLGHLYSALEARRLADAQGGEMRLRIEDIDAPRCRPAFHQAILEDLEFMGVAWEGEVMVQSGRMEAYAAALESLKERELAYPCFLSRRELDDLLSAPHGPNEPQSSRNSRDSQGSRGSQGSQNSRDSQGARGSQGLLNDPQDPHGGGDADRATNTDRLIDASIAAERRESGQEPAWRLRMEAVAPLLKGLDYENHGHGREPVGFTGLGDPVIARKDIATSYHLAVVVDDAAQGVTHIVRGMDLLDSTPLHRVLQALLDLPETVWSHHPLVLDGGGRRLSNRGDAMPIRAMRHAGMDAAAILKALETSEKG